MPHTNDIQFAQKLCESKDFQSEMSVQGEFLDQYKDDLYFIASKLCGPTDSSEYWNYQTESQYSIRVDDNISQCLLWLVKTAAVKSCKYLGDKGATFSTYIKAVLNSDYTRIDWIRHIKGDLRAPKPIKEMGEEYVQLYRYLRKGESESIVMSDMTMSLGEYEYMRSEIEDRLAKEGMLDLLKKPQTITIGPSAKENSKEDEIEIDVQDSGLTPDQQTELEEVNTMCETLLSSLLAAEQKLLILYWTPAQVKLSVNDIFNTLSFPSFSEYRTLLDINSPEDIYSKIDEIVRKTMKIAAKEYSKIVEDYKIDPKGMKSILRNYIKNRNHERLEV